MTLEEARTRLGLPPSGPLEPAELRRAYLQAIKRCKPEVDPEGFQAVREAYELLDPLVRAGDPLVKQSPIAVVIETPGRTDRPDGRHDIDDDDEDEDDEAAAVDSFASAPHLAPYRQRLVGLFGQPWQVRAQVGWDAYRAFPGDPAARAFLLSLLPEEAFHDRTIVLREGVAAGDRDCLLQLLEVAPDAVPPDAFARLESEGSTFERLLVAGACVARNEPERALALLDQMLAAGAGGLPDLGLVYGALRLGLRFEGRGDGPRARTVWARLRESLGGTALPAGAPREIAALYALAAGLEKAEYLPAEVRGEVARGALQWSWPGLTRTLSLAEHVHGKSYLKRALARVRADSPALAALLDQHRRLALTTTNWNAILRIVGPLLLVVVGNLTFNRCDSPPPPSSRMIRDIGEGLLAHERGGMIEQLEAEANLLCRPTDQREMCRVLPPLLDSLRGSTPCLDPTPVLDHLVHEAKNATDRDYLARVRAALPALCKP